jgi:hypothetical protein
MKGAKEVGRAIDQDQGGISHQFST